MANIKSMRMHSLIAFLFFVLFAFDVGQTETTLSNRNEFREIDVDGFHGPSDHADSDGPEYNTAAESDDGLGDVELAMDEQWRTASKRWVPTEVNAGAVRQKVLLSKIVSSNDRQGKRQSRSFHPSPDDYAAATNEELFPKFHPHHRHLKDGRRSFSGEEKLGHQPNRFVYRPEVADDGNAESLSIVEHPGQVSKVTSKMREVPFVQRNNEHISKWKKILERPGNDQKQLRAAIFILSDYLDRQRERNISRQWQSIRQKKNRQEEKEEKEERQGQRIRGLKGQRDDQANAEPIALWYDPLNGV